MNDVSARGEPAAAAVAEVAAAPSRRVRVRPLMALVPYVMRYRGQVIAALVALLVASAATLIVPVADWSAKLTPLVVAPAVTATPCGFAPGHTAH